MINYYALEAKSNLKGDDDQYRFYVEREDGGGIEYIADTVEEAENWCKDNGGILTEVL
jgi:hypothetical protein